MRISVGVASDTQLLQIRPVLVRDNPGEWFPIGEKINRDVRVPVVTVPGPSGDPDVRVYVNVIFRGHKLNRA